METLYVVHRNGDTFSFQVNGWEVTGSGCLLLYKENENQVVSLHTAFSRKEWEYASHSDPRDLEAVE